MQIEAPPTKLKGGWVFCLLLLLILPLFYMSLL